jgi:nucleotide-binding universal stress UspA family protein
MKSLNSIVAPTDFSEPSTQAVRRAAFLARAEGASLHLVHALRLPVIASPHPVSVPASVWEGIREGMEQEMESLRVEVEASGVSSVTSRVEEAGGAVDAIEAACSAHAADLVVMGTHGRGGFKHALLGSVTERVIRTLACPVLAVKEDRDASEKAIERILLPTDFSSHSDLACELAMGLAARHGASIDVLHAFEFLPEYATYLSPEAVDVERRMESDAKDQVEKILGRISAEKVRASSHVLRGAPQDVIPREAERLGSDLIVMGTHGRSGLSHFLIGSVTEKTLRSAPCSVLVAKADLP